MLFFTGDCHGQFHKLGSACFPEGKQLTKDDVVIITGDFGGVWNVNGEDKEESYWLDWLENKPFTIAFVDGNHECFPRLQGYPTKEWNGGVVHEIRPSVLHLCRGEVYEIDNKKIFAFGGARSHDISDGILDIGDPEIEKKLHNLKMQGKRMYRIYGLNWWPEEMPSEEEMEHGIANLQKHNFQVDYVVTHDCPNFVRSLIFNGKSDSDELTTYLQSLVYEHGLEFKKWYFGHHHLDHHILDRFEILYNETVPAENTKSLFLEKEEDDFNVNR